MEGLEQDCVDPEGWTYALDFPYLKFPPPPGTGKCTLKHFVRRRRWYRVRVRTEPGLLRRRQQQAGAEDAEGTEEAAEDGPASAAGLDSDTPRSSYDTIGGARPESTELGFGVGRASSEAGGPGSAPHSGSFKSGSFKSAGTTPRALATSPPAAPSWLLGAATAAGLSSSPPSTVPPLPATRAGSSKAAGPVKQELVPAVSRRGGGGGRAGGAPGGAGKEDGRSVEMLASTNSWTSFQGAQTGGVDVAEGEVDSGPHHHGPNAAPPVPVAAAPAPPRVAPPVPASASSAQDRGSGGRRGAGTAAEGAQGVSRGSKELALAAAAALAEPGVCYGDPLGVSNPASPTEGAWGGGEAGSGSEAKPWSPQQQQQQRPGSGTAMGDSAVAMLVSGLTSTASAGESSGSAQLPPPSARTQKQKQKGAAAAPDLAAAAAGMGQGTGQGGKDNFSFGPPSGGSGGGG